MSSDTILARIELASDNAVLAERSTDRFADLTNSAVRVDYLRLISIHPVSIHVSWQEHTLLSNSTCAANHARVLARDSIGILVCAELVSGSGGLVRHVAGLCCVVWCRLVCGAEAELFAEGTGGFGHLVYGCKELLNGVY